jgi:hypothetical protein
MREDRIAGATAHALDVQNVDVDLARPVTKGRRPADDSLDRLDLAEQPFRRARPGDGGDGVPERRLPGEPHGVGPVIGGDRQDDGAPGDLVERALDALPGVSAV